MIERNAYRGSTLSISILFGVLFLLIGPVLHAQEYPKAKEGKYELTSALLDKKQILDLHGEWKFKSLSADSLPETYQTVPQSWSNYTVRGQSLPMLGQGVYELTVDNPEIIENLCLYIFGISTSYKVWINGHMVSAKGIFSEKGFPVRGRDIIDLPNGYEYYYIKILVDNHEHSAAGLNVGPLIAKKSFLYPNEKLRMNWEMLQLGAVILMALYHLVLYFQLRKPAYLLMSLLCTTVLVRSTVVFDGSLILYDLIPSLDFVIAKKIEYIAVYAGVFLPLMFVRYLFESKRFLLPLRILQIIGGAMIIVVFFTPPYIFGQTLNFFHWVFVAGFLLVFLQLFYAIKERKQGAVLVSLGVLFCFIFIFFEILRNSGYREVSNFGANFVDTGVIVFLFFQTIAISGIFANAFRENHRFSKELETMVEQRTEQLSKSNVVKDRMFSIISHDLKSPLNSLKGLTTLAEMGGLSKEEEKGLFKQINQGLNNTLSLLDNLLSWASSQMHGKQTKLIMERFDLHDVIQESIVALNDTAQRKALNVRNQSTATNWVMADRNMMKMVVRNLLNNAIKFTPKGGKITLDVVKGKEHYIVSVKDTGIGMPPEILQNLFDVATKSRQGTQEEKGTGIGLLLCKDLVEQNGGKIWAESDVEGGGSVFKFTVPIKTN